MTGQGQALAAVACHGPHLRPDYKSPCCHAFLLSPCYHAHPADPYHPPTLPSAGAKLVQLVRSTPLLTTTLVGHKAAEHVVANVALAKAAPLRPGPWRRTHREVEALLTA